MYTTHEVDENCCNSHTSDKRFEQNDEFNQEFKQLNSARKKIKEKTKCENLKKKN